MAVYLMRKLFSDGYKRRISLFSEDDERDTNIGRGLAIGAGGLAIGAGTGYGIHKALEEKLKDRYISKEQEKFNKLRSEAYDRMGDRLNDVRYLENESAWDRLTHKAQRERKKVINQIGRERKALGKKGEEFARKTEREAENYAKKGRGKYAAIGAGILGVGGYLAGQ